MVKNPWKVAFFSLAVFVMFSFLIMVLFVKHVGSDNLKLLFTLNQAEHDYLIPMHILNTTDQLIVPVKVTQNGHRIYLTNLTRSTDVKKLLRERMNQKGWTFTRQTGAAYFFKKEKEKHKGVVTTSIWNSDYVKISVRNNSVNIASDSGL